MVQWFIEEECLNNCLVYILEKNCTPFKNYYYIFLIFLCVLW